MSSDEVTGLLTMERRFPKFMDGEIFSDREAGVDVVDDVAEGRWLHSVREGVVQRRAVGFEVVEVLAEGDYSDYVEDRLLDGCFN